MASHDTDLKGEDAIRNYLVGLDIGLTTANVFRSFQPHTETVALPYVAIKCLGGMQAAPKSATERLTFLIELHSTAILHATNLPDPEGAHRELWRAILGGLYVTNLAALLSAQAEDFTVHPDEIDFNRGPNNTIENRYVSQMALVMTCSPSDIT